jgi:hypothetical protein
LAKSHRTFGGEVEIIRFPVHGSIGNARDTIFANRTGNEVFHIQAIKNT